MQAKKARYGCIPDTPRLPKWLGIQLVFQCVTGRHLHHFLHQFYLQLLNTFQAQTLDWRTHAVLSLDLVISNQSVIYMCKQEFDY